MKNIFNVPCSNCGNITKELNKELFGKFFIALVIPFLFFFEVTAGSIMYSMIFLGVGLYWVIAKPSKKVTCGDCKIEK